MKKLNFKKGMTLIELIVASVIMLIVIAGVASIDTGIRRAFKGTSENAILSAEISSIMHHIAGHINQATGWTGDLGVRVAEGNTRRLYIRVDQNDTADNFTDDIWFCYEFNFFASSEERGIQFCNVANPFSTCPPDSVWLQRGRIMGFQALIVNDFDETPQEYYVEVTITGRFDPEEDENPLSNPEFTLTSRFNLSSMSAR